MCKKELRVLYQGYKKEESLVQLDVNILGDKPDAEDEDVTPSEATGKKSKKQVLTPLQTWDKSRRTYLFKIVNAKKAMNGYLEEVFTLHEHLLGKELRPQWTEIMKKTCFTVSWKDEKGKSQNVQRGYSWVALDLVLRE